MMFMVIKLVRDKSRRKKNKIYKTKCLNQICFQILQSIKPYFVYQI